MQVLNVGGHAFQRFAGSDVVHNYAAVRLPVERAGERSVLLSAAGVPNGHSHLCILLVYYLLLVDHPNGRLPLGAEHIIRVAHYELRLSNRGVAQQNGLECVHLSGLVWSNGITWPSRAFPIAHLGLRRTPRTCMRPGRPPS